MNNTKYGMFNDNEIAEAAKYIADFNTSGNVYCSYQYILSKFGVNCPQMANYTITENSVLNDIDYMYMIQYYSKLEKLERSIIITLCIHYQKKPTLVAMLNYVYR